MLEILLKMQGGPYEGWIGFSDRLRAIRLEHAVWLPAELDTSLSFLESSMKRVGINKEQLDELSVGPDRTGVVQEMLALFKEVTQADAAPETASINAAILKLKSLLGVEELSILRVRVLQRAKATLDEL